MKYQSPEIFGNISIMVINSSVAEHQKHLHERGSSPVPVSVSAHLYVSWRPIDSRWVQGSALQDLAAGIRTVSCSKDLLMQSD